MKQYPKLKAITVRRLLKIRDDILAEAKLYDQWDPLVPKADCGTTGCILGFAVARYGDKGSHFVTTGAGLTILKLDYRQSDILYSDWPRKWMRRLNKHPQGSRAAARVAFHFINHFIKTGGTMK